MSEHIQNIRENLADEFQALADKDTLFRFENAESIGDLIAESDPSAFIIFAVIGAIVSDKTDGFWATIAKKVRGYDVPTAGGALDPEADHRLMKEILEGLSARFEREGDLKSTARINDILVRNGSRDARMDQNRQTIRENDIDEKEMRTNKYNKYKMVLQTMGSVTLTSTLSRHAVIKRSSLAVIKAGTKSGEIGERKFREKVATLIAENQTSS